MSEETRRGIGKCANTKRVSDSPQTENRISEIQKRLAAVRDELSELDRYTPEINARYAQIAVAREAISTNETLGKKSIEFGREIASIQELITAYGEGGRAIASAEIDQQLDAGEDREPASGVRAPAENAGKRNRLVAARTGFCGR